MNKSDIPFISVAELARLIETRQVSPVEATEAYLDRIDSLDSKFNSYVTVCRTEALHAAEQAERAIAQGHYLGPMHGIPVAVKDQFWTKGIRTTAGSLFLAHFVPQEDATVVANLAKAGAVLLGKTNMSEFAMGGTARINSAPRNPWDLNVYTGGSSSGSAAATAAFLCATSLGEDTAGSIRWPAAWCGLVGLRPSWGRVSRYGVVPVAWSMDAVGPISRTVEDAAITFQAIAGYDPKDPYTWNVPVPDYRQAINGDIRGVRICTITEQINSDLVEPEVRDAVVKAISVLSELGASVKEISLPLTMHCGVVSSVFTAVEPALDHRQWIKNRLQDYAHSNRIGLLTGSVVPAHVYYKAQKLRTMIRQQVLEALDVCDVLLTPTLGTTPQAIDNTGSKYAGKEAAKLLPARRIFNLANAPAISIPCGFSAEGLPIGLQLGGRPGGEETVLRVAHAYEQITSWHTRKPNSA